VYDETSHSHAVEEQERSQAQGEVQGQRISGAWSIADEHVEEEVGGPTRAIQAQIAAQLNAMMQGTKIS
jgi:hypothetical protein